MMDKDKEIVWDRLKNGVASSVSKFDLPSGPAIPIVKGSLYYDIIADCVMVYNGAEWKPIGWDN